MKVQDKFVLWFNEISMNDVSRVGGKNASLGEMYRNLTKKGVKVPNGFAITAYAYKYVLEKAGVLPKLRSVLRGLNAKNVRALEEAGRKARELILRAEFPPELRVAIADAYKKLCKEYRTTSVDVAVRSSATAEDLPTASFAGQQETFLNVRGVESLIDACRRCFASLFTNRAIAYRVENGFNHFKVYLSVGVQKMVRSDLACAGVMFTLDTETGFPDVVLINASYGLGESVVQGAVNPDEFYVFKPTLKKRFKPVISKILGSKSSKIIYSDNVKSPVKKVPTPVDDRNKFCLSDVEVLNLAEWAVVIEEYYTLRNNGKWTPMDIEWAKDGVSGELFIVQARPETVQSVKKKNMLEVYKLSKRGKVLAQGRAVGDKIGQGLAAVIKDVRDISKFKPGQVLVTEMTDPDWVPAMRIASAIVTNKGGRTCFGGRTKILTDKGVFSFEEVFERFNDGESFFVWSVNRDSLKSEWKRVVSVTKNKLPAVRVSCSQTGRVDDNWIETTLDHKFFTFENRKLVKKEIKSIIDMQEAVNVVDSLPKTDLIVDSSVDKLAYLVGAFASDGHIELRRGKSAFRRGSVVFTQKFVPEKTEFINTVNEYFVELFEKPLIAREKHSVSVLRGRLISGCAVALRFTSLFAELDSFVLKLDNVSALKFLAGLIDGDGTFFNNRLQIYIKKKHVLEAVVIACLKNGIVPQVTKNRGIFNVQIVEKLDKILEHTKRVKGDARKKVLGTKLFAARQMFGDIVDEVNLGGKIKPYVKNNLLIGVDVFAKTLSRSSPDHALEIKKVLNSDIRMHRVKFVEDLGSIDVFNIEVDACDELDHNYVVFTERYTPLLVSNSHAAIVSRELGLPCVVGTGNATQKIKNNKPVTVSCAEGDVGFVYDGLLKFRVDKVDLKKLPKIKTKLMVNLGNPDAAFETSFLPVDGVGLAREEFIVTEFIKIHPLALINFDSLKDEAAKSKILELTQGYKDKTQFYVDKLAMGVGMIAAAFYPKPVILRFSDFKSNEYANLIGGKDFEPHEENPMIGWRGASRYYNPRFKPAFVLECKAVKKVREVFGLTNLKVMVPFCRTVDEGKKVLAVMREAGLVPGRNGLEVFVMCEIPSNVVLADEFSKVFDGFSIGSNDLTQLSLGVDRDSVLVSSVFDERNEAVLRLVEHVISVAKKHKRKIGICGDAPSTYPEFARFLVDCGIDSISLSPDAVVKTLVNLAKYKKKRR